MFAQVIQGKTNDAEGFARQIDRWTADLKPGAKGFVGSTGGVAADGTTFAVVRFESEEAANANGARPEQSAWFEELRKTIDGEPAFRNSNDVQVMGEPSDAAGFVQVMTYDVSDRPALEALEATVMPDLMKTRPDVLGMMRVWDGKTAVDVLYFSSQADAREGEKKMGSNPEMAKQMEQFGQLGTEPTFIDLTDPILRSA